jgi:hypothetical protein
VEQSVSTSLQKILDFYIAHPLAAPSIPLTLLPVKKRIQRAIRIQKNKTKTKSL